MTVQTKRYLWQNMDSELRAKSIIVIYDIDIPNIIKLGRLTVKTRYFSSYVYLDSFNKLIFKLSPSIRSLLTWASCLSWYCFDLGVRYGAPLYLPMTARTPLARRKIIRMKHFRVQIECYSPKLLFCFLTVNKTAGLLQPQNTLLSSGSWLLLGSGILGFVAFWFLFTLVGGADCLGWLAVGGATNCLCWFCCGLAFTEFVVLTLLLLELLIVFCVCGTCLTLDRLIWSSSRNVSSQPPKQAVYGGGYRWLIELFLHSNFTVS